MTLKYRLFGLPGNMDEFERVAVYQGGPVSVEVESRGIKLGETLADTYHPADVFLVSSQGTRYKALSIADHYFSDDFHRIAGIIHDLRQREIFVNEVRFPGKIFHPSDFRGKVF